MEPDLKQVKEENSNPEIRHDYDEFDDFKKIDKKWTSGNKELDDLIKELQLKAKYKDKVMEWIPYDRLENIQKIDEGTFDTIYSAIWLDGKRIYLKKNNKLILSRKKCKVTLKEPNKLFHKGIFEKFKTFAEFGNQKNFFEVYGITRHPETEQYMIVCQYANGNLREYLDANFKKLTWEDKLKLLFSVAYNLSLIHNMGYVHKNLQSENIYVNTNVTNTTAYIFDFWWCNKIEDDNTVDDDIQEVLNYVFDYAAPEILSLSSEFTTAADIYSFGVILTEASKGIRPYSDLDVGKTKLALMIAKRGLRPEFGEGTPKPYINLAKQCMDANPEKRPSAEKICQILFNWYRIFDFDLECLNEEELQMRKADEK
ncbi:kinase-like domain-containing protein [Gigaspora rosea]|uniref:Kinase-like domain-containing protein n=1 Tax=Gigaspora rosea TaxID=44941 RepID=A0A397WBG0_9GLOM|nr:kinase-like domain-containing protein [Gigaspora rosea]